MAKLKARLSDPSAWYAAYLEASKKEAGSIQPENRSGPYERLEEIRAIMAAEHAKRKHTQRGHSELFVKWVL